MTSTNERTTNNQQLDRPLSASSAQVQYLRYLLMRAHQYGVPYLPVDALSRGAVSAWIDYLQAVTGEFNNEEEGTTPSPSAFSVGGAV
jgi:hypothetical protein